MSTWLQAGRLGPIVAGLAGLGWFVAELAPQGYGFADTDDPSVSLAFVSEHPTDWALAGVLLLVASVALIVTVIVIGDRLKAGAARDATVGSDVASRAITVLGLLAAAFLFGHGVVRMSGGPLLYVNGLDAGWGETAYLVTQFVGVHLLAQGGILLLSTWIVAAAWFGHRRRVMAAPFVLLALIPGARLLAVLGPWSLLPEGLWIFFMAAIPAAFLWLVLMGVSSADTLATRTARPAPRVPEASEATAS
jgi:hypothetical protein